MYLGSRKTTGSTRVCDLEKKIRACQGDWLLDLGTYQRRFHISTNTRLVSRSLIVRKWVLLTHWNPVSTLPSHASDTRRSNASITERTNELLVLYFFKVCNTSVVVVVLSQIIPVINVCINHKWDLLHVRWRKGSLLHSKGQLLCQEGLWNYLETHLVTFCTVIRGNKQHGLIWAHVRQQSNPQAEH